MDDAFSLCQTGSLIDATSGATATVTSPLGAVSLRVDGSHGVTVEVTPTDVPDLPEGMAVDNVVLVTVGIARVVTREMPLLLEATFDHEGDVETGQWLESVAFRTDEGTLQVAVRDSEWLATKGVVAELDYKSRGFRQTILEAAAGSRLDVSVAWQVGGRARTADNVSTWFAADLALPG